PGVDQRRYEAVAGERAERQPRADRHADHRADQQRDPGYPQGQQHDTPDVRIAAEEETECPNESAEDVIHPTIAPPASPVGRRAAVRTRPDRSSRSSPAPPAR